MLEACHLVALACLLLLGSAEDLQHPELTHVLELQ